MSILKFALLCFISALLLMVASFYNGFPFGEGDTHAYITTAFSFTKSITSDRPPFYGIFIRISSLGHTLWLTAFFQALLLSYLLLKYIRFFYADAGSRFIIASIITITSFTCVSWIAGYIMPDIFAAILLLAILLFLLDERASVTQKIVYLLIIFLSTSVHNSHLPIVLLFAFTLLVMALIKKSRHIVRRSIILLGVSFFYLLVICSVNDRYGYGFTYSPDSYKFTMTKFAESGILDVYLNDSCGKKPLIFCNYKDQIPSYPWSFMFSSESPVDKLGGWDSCRNECRVIIHDVFSTRKYTIMYFERSAMSTLMQLSQVQIADTPSVARHYMLEELRQYFGKDEKQFVRAKQNNSSINGNDANIIYILFFAVTSIWILIFYKQVVNSKILMLYSCLLLLFVINAFVTSTFSTVHYRFQSRIFWILPATNAIIILRYYWEKNMQFIGSSK